MKNKLILGFGTLATITTPIIGVVACDSESKEEALRVDFKSTLTYEQKVSAFNNIISMRRILDSGLNIAQDGTITYKKLSTRDDSGKKTETYTDLTEAIKNGIYEFNMQSSKGNFFNEGANLIGSIAEETRFFAYMLAHAINIHLNNKDDLMTDAGLNNESTAIAKYLGEKYLAKNKNLQKVAQKFLAEVKKLAPKGGLNKLSSKSLNKIAAKFFEVNGGIEYLIGFGYQFTIGAWWANTEFVGSIKGIKFLQAFLSKEGIKENDNILTKQYSKLALNQQDLETGVEPTKQKVRLAGQPLLPGSGNNWQEMSFTYENDVASTQTLPTGWYFQIAKLGSAISPTVNIIKAPKYKYTPPSEGDEITISNFSWQVDTIEIAISGLSNGVLDGTYKNKIVTRSGYDNSYEMHFKRVGAPKSETSLLIFLPHLKTPISSTTAAPVGTRIFLAKAPWNIFWFKAPRTRMQAAISNKALYEFLVKADGSTEGSIFKYTDVIGSKLSTSLKAQ